MKRLVHWAAALVATLASGCGVDLGDTWSVSTGAGGDGGGGAGGTGSISLCPEDPARGPVHPDCGIWVSTTDGDDAQPGSQTEPVRTLARAIELAAEGTGRVYACNEDWLETLLVPGNVSLHGGFDCKNGWAYVGGQSKSTVSAKTPIGMTYVESGKEERPFLTDFHIESADGEYPGGSSIALFIRDDVPITIERCEIVAGTGADGVDGADGGAGEAPSAPSGAPGIDGAGACSAPLSKGGAATETVCGQIVSNGGEGGDGGPLIAENGADGDDAGAPYGVGGLGEQLAPSCTDGSPGSDGTRGASGLGGPVSGQRLTSEGYIGAWGEEGQPGTPGKGGGGGGATFGSAAVCGAASPGGAAGGSGGAGGCGGKGGKGGQPGGSSIGVALHTANHDVLIKDTSIIVRDAGDGGDGGLPQQGGDGGLPGMGGAGLGTIKPGCKGGNGGLGGEGGIGGGGLGGSTLCIAYAKPYGASVWQVKCQVGAPGFGGDGDPWLDYSWGGFGNSTDYRGLDP